MWTCFSSTWDYICVAVCLAGVAQLGFALLGPAVDRAKRVVPGGIPTIRPLMAGLCYFLLEIASVSPIDPALPVPSPLASCSQQGLPPLLHFPQMVAGFSFAARSPQEVSLQAGQPVVVLEPHDKKGSKEWSLVEVNGQRGYVPSSYLVTVPVQEPMGWSVPV